MPYYKDITGIKFNRLTALKLMPERTKDGNALWLCECECGTQIVVQGANLRSGNTKSCGCLRVEKFVARNTVHGLHDHKLYQTWRQMIDRCEKPDDKNFHHYGGRGIKVCERWRNGEDGKHGFVCFLADKGERPKGMTLDRYPDTNGDYTPENTRWATQRQQLLGRRKSPTWGITQTRCGYYGVRMQILPGEKPYSFGTFNSLANAIATRDRAELARRFLNWEEYQ